MRRLVVSMRWKSPNHRLMSISSDSWPFRRLIFVRCPWAHLHFQGCLQRCRCWEMIWEIWWCIWCFRWLWVKMHWQETWFRCHWICLKHCFSAWSIVISLFLVCFREAFPRLFWALPGLCLWIWFYWFRVFRMRQCSCRIMMFSKVQNGDWHSWFALCWILGR